MATTQTTLGGLIYRLRLVRGLTQTDLTRLSGVSAATVSLLERDEPNRQWRPDTLRAVFSALHGVAPLTAEDVAAIGRASGLDGGAIVGTGPAARALLGQATRDQIRAGDAASMDRVRRGVSEVLRLAGPARTADALECLASLLSGPAHPSADVGPAGPRAVVRQTSEEGHVVTEYAPVPARPEPTPRAAGPRRAARG